MYKTEWSITSKYWDWTREDFLFTFSEEEKIKIEMDSNNAKLIYRADFYPSYTSFTMFDIDSVEALILWFFYYWTKKWSRIYVKNEDLAEICFTSESTVSRRIWDLEKRWFLNVKEKKLKTWTDRKIQVTTALVNLMSGKIQVNNWEKIKNINDFLNSTRQIDESYNINNKNNIDLLPNGNKCVDTQKENLWWIDTIETQQTEKEASWQNQKNIRECITEEWKAYNEIIERWVTFDDVFNAYPKTRIWFNKEDCEKIYKELLEKWYSPNKIFEVAFLEKLRLRVKSALWKDDYRYIIKFDKFLKTYYEIDDDWIDLYIDEIVQLYENTKENHKYKESIISILRDIYWFARIKPFYNMHKKNRMTIMVDWKILNQ